MSRRIEEIEADVARSRARLEQTLQRIEHKLSASGMVDDALASLRRTRHGEVVDRAMGVLRDNPVPVLAVMAGIGWLIGRAGSRRGHDDEPASNSSRAGAFSPGSHATRAPHPQPADPVNREASPRDSVRPDVPPQPRK
jgi:ElaB/YqjD/DUF883 family membrane-anchored ribosome-binding protein